MTAVCVVCRVGLMRRMSVELDEEGVGAGSLCRVHDSDDVVAGRVCGRPLPCRDHGGPGIASAFRWYLGLANEARHRGLHVLADWYMHLAKVAAT